MTTRTTITKRIAPLMLALALFGAACAEGDVAVDEESSSTTVATDESTTTSTLETTTTLAADPTTTTLTDDGNAEYEALVDRVTNAPELASGRMEATVSITGLEGEQAGMSEVSFGFTTAFDNAADRSALVMDLSSLAAAAPTAADDPFAELAAGFAGTMEVRQIGDVAYLKMPFFTELLGVPTPWLEVSADDGDGFSSGFSAVPTDPNEVLTTYDGADVSVEEIGSETVNGSETTHYRVSFDTSPWVAELSAEERAELEASGLFADGVVPMDLWIRSDGHLVRLVFAVDGSSVEAKPGEEFDSMTIQYDLLDINEPVSIEAPPASEVTSFEDLGFGDFEFDFGAEA